ncbi:MAG: hypothetical protein RLZZ227_1606 [Pseudomonadota bacterium]|jgi:hypothetical protein
MSNALQQINLNYVPEEDRLLLKVRTADEAEYRIWFTRRYSALLLQIFTDRIEREGGYQELASRKQTLDQLRGGAFDHSYDAPSKAQYPLGENGVLGYRINVGKDDSGATTLQLLPEQGQGVTFTMDKSTLYMLYNLLEQALPQTEWNLHGSGTARGPLH